MKNKAWFQSQCILTRYSPVWCFSFSIQQRVWLLRGMQRRFSPNYHLSFSLFILQKKFLLQRQETFFGNQMQICVKVQCLKCCNWLAYFIGCKSIWITAWRLWRPYIFACSFTCSTLWGPIGMNAGRGGVRATAERWKTTTKTHITTAKRCKS